MRKIILGPDLARQRIKGAEVDRLRQVVFGEQMEGYERRFADVRREMERILSDLRVVQDAHRNLYSDHHTHAFAL